MFAKLSVEVIRRTLPIAVAAAVLAVFASILFTIVTGGRYAWWNQDKSTQSTGGQPAASAPAQQEAPAQAGEQAQAVAAATGCVSQDGDRAAQLLATQDQVGVDAIGAAEVAGAWIRWVQTEPTQSEDEVLKRTTTDPADMATLLNGNFSDRTATLDKSGYRTNIMNGVAYVDVTVNWHENARPNDEMIARASLNLVPRDGKWLVSSVKPPTLGGTQFDHGMSVYTDGC